MAGPGWVDKKKVRCSIQHAGANGAVKVDAPRSGSRLIFQGLSPRDVITIEFPQRIWEDRYTIHGKKFTVTFRGSTVLDVQPRPKGTLYGYYDRDHLRGNKAPMKEVRRFASDKLIPLGTY